eukprot:1393281-Amorphochlora_amoeboformis.AAC.1
MVYRLRAIGLDGLLVVTFRGLQGWAAQPDTHTIRPDIVVIVVILPIVIVCTRRTAILVTFGPIRSQ